MSFDSLPSKWSIASCLFPHEENPTKPGPGPHPVLIAGIIPEKNLVLAAYGTGQSSIALASELEPYQIEIGIGTSYLKYVTRFDFRKAVPLEWSSEWFKPIAHNVPIIMGRLDLAQTIRANKAAQAWQALLAGGAAPWGAATAVAAPAQGVILQAAQPIVVHRKRRTYSPPGGE